MTWVSALAIFFIVWWLTLFAVLPFGLRTQDEERDVTFGTTPSAPRGPHMRRAMAITTVVAVIIFTVLWFVPGYFGVGFEDIPRIVPSFD